MLVQFDPIALEIGPLAIRWYGLMYLVGLGLGYLVACRYTRLPHVKWTRDEIADAVFYIFLGVILGGRFGYVLFYQWERIGADPWFIFRLWEGGMSFHGGLIGVLLAFLYYAVKTRRRFFEVADFFAPFVPIGLMAGRIGNFINGELYGRVTDLPIAVTFASDPRRLPRHPSQLYEALFEGLLLAILLLWLAKKPRPLGFISAIFLIGYGISRFALEYVREPDAHLGVLSLNLTMGQWLTIPMMLFGCGILWWGKQKRMNKA